MDDALRMDDDFDALGLDVEQPARLFVGEQNALAGARGGKRRWQACGADDRRHDDVAVALRCHALERRAPEEQLRTGLFEFSSKILFFRHARQYGESRPMALAQL